MLNWVWLTNYRICTIFVISSSLAHTRKWHDALWAGLCFRAYEGLWHVLACFATVYHSLACYDVRRGQKIRPCFLPPPQPMSWVHKLCILCAATTIILVTLNVIISVIFIVIVIMNLYYFNSYHQRNDHQSIYMISNHDIAIGNHHHPHHHHHHHHHHGDHSK